PGFPCRLSELFPPQIVRGLVQRALCERLAFEPWCKFRPQQRRVVERLPLQFAPNPLQGRRHFGDRRSIVIVRGRFPLSSQGAFLQFHDQRRLDTDRFPRNREDVAQTQFERVQVKLHGGYGFCHSPEALKRNTASTSSSGPWRITSQAGRSNSARTRWRSVSASAADNRRLFIAMPSTRQRKSTLTLAITS